MYQCISSETPDTLAGVNVESGLLLSVILCPKMQKCIYISNFAVTPLRKKGNNPYMFLSKVNWSSPLSQCALPLPLCGAVGTS